MKSIFERIDALVKECGCVPEGYVLEDALKGDEKPALVMGEQEGLIGQPIPMPPKGMLGKAVDMIRNNLEINARLAVHSFDDEELGFRVADIRGLLLKNIIDNIKDYDPHKLSTLAYSLTMFGTKLETVKLGLLILVLFDFADDEVIRKHIITLGLYEEFTSYVISNAKSWPKEISDHVYYIYARKLSGWGKINAMECLEPVNDEVRDWVLCHGCRNDISFGYLGKAAYEKCDFENALRRGNLNEEQMQGARDIMRGLLEDMPGRGISEVNNPALLTMLYLKELAEHNMDLEDVSNLYELKNYLRGNERSSESDNNKAIQIIDRLLSLSDAEDMIKKGVSEDPELAVPTASEAGMDIADELLEFVNSDFLHYYKYVYYFMRDGVYVDEFLNICSKNLVGRDFKEGMGTEEPEPDSENTWQLDVVLKYLGTYPGEGGKLLVTAINSSILQYRQQAAETIRQWEELKGLPLKKISSEVFHAVKKIKKKEVDEELKKAWDEVLDFK